MHPPKLCWLHSSLARHIVLVLLIKVLALIGLWQAFVAPQKKTVDAPRMAARIAPSLVSQSLKEVNHDD